MWLMPSICSRQGQVSRLERGPPDSYAHHPPRRSCASGLHDKAHRTSRSGQDKTRSAWEGRDHH